MTKKNEIRPFQRPYYAIISGIETFDGIIGSREIEKEFDISPQMFETILFQTDNNIKEYNLGNYKGKHTEDTIKKISRKAIAPKVRWKVLQKDNFKCVKCGRGINDVDCLQVDHILPVSKGGDNQIENLQTLCWECNIGKFNKEEKNE